MGFSLLDMLAKPAEQEGHIKRILVDKIEPSKQNFYDVSEIAELKASMRIFGDVQIAIVSPIDDSDRYRLISGHRRRLAHLELKEEGTEGFDEMLCFVRDGDPDSGDIASRLLLILSNSTARNLSDYERAQQVVELKRLLTEYRAAGNDIPGSLRSYIAEVLDISETQVQRYETIDKSLRPEIKEAFAADEINVSVAAELATEEPEKQMEIFEALQERGELNVKAVREAKKPPDLVYQTAHEIKCWPQYYQATTDGRKMFEYRLNDRDYKLGDFLILREYDQGYTGREKQVQITYVLAGPEMDVPEGMVILGIKSLN